MSVTTASPTAFKTTKVISLSLAILFTSMPSTPAQAALKVVAPTVVHLYVFTLMVSVEVPPVVRFPVLITGLPSSLF